MRTPAPTWIQLLGLVTTLVVVGVFTGFTLRQLEGLKLLGADIVERNRRDSLELIRIQDDVLQLGLALRNMERGSETGSLTAYREHLEGLKRDLQEAMALEAQLKPASRTAAQQSDLERTFDRFWRQVDQLWPAAEAGDRQAVRALIRTRLEKESTTLATVISRLLVQNNEAEAEAVVKIQGIYDKVERTLWLMLAVGVGLITVTGSLVIWHDRRMFQQVSRLSEERKELAGQMIRVQEDLFRTLARELHDEFGQVLTAAGMMLRRVEKKLPEGSAEQADLREVREIANQTLERVRGLSQMLHPPVLDDYGLEKSIEWYVDQFKKQTGLQVHYEKSGGGTWIGAGAAIHVYRILQEALSNAARHAKTAEIWVTARYGAEQMELDVEDHGVGLPEAMRARGLGMIGMRERAELLGGRLEFQRVAGGGTKVRLKVPLPKKGDRG
ncbi:MAG: sensor histidine kinase [Acidobacteria bacterium]|nr:sensor histidine kinase [Acidobacteriota bacterium]